MTATLQEIERRVNALENEARELRSLLGNGARNLSKPWKDAWARLQHEIGIQGQPIGAENVQAMIAACGYKPEDNEFSREIIPMREE